MPRSPKNKREKSEKTTESFEYKYSKLPDETKFLRMLELIPGKRFDVLRVRLRTYPIDSCPKYDALSYVWGDPGDKDWILCDNKHLEIPRSLHEVLVELRNENESHVLWADSICINQANEEEQGHQVQKMGTVFAEAEIVYVWLGHDDGFDAREIFEMIESFDGLERVEVMRSAEQIQPYQWKALATIFRLPWFRRVWTAQEIGLASTGILLHGHDKIGWKTFKSACQNLQFCQKVLARYDVWVDRVTAFELDFKAGKESPCELLQMAKNRNCSQPQDRVFGILGHATFRQVRTYLGGEDFMTPNYHRPLYEIYHEVAEKLLRLPDPLFILTQVDHDERSLEDMEKASWVPRWDYRVGKRLLAAYKLGKNRGLGFFNASKDTREQIFHSDKNILEIRGVLLDSIQWQSDPFENDGSRSRHDPLVKDIWKRLRNRHAASVISEEQDLRRFCMTIHTEGENYCYPSMPAERQVANCLAYLSRNGINLLTQGYLNMRYPSGDAEELFVYAQENCRNMRFALTEKGYFGLVPLCSRPGDKICIFFGSPVPYLLRPQPNGNEYRFCGGCYIADMMDGEAIELLEKGGLEAETLRLV